MRSIWTFVWLLLQLLAGCGVAAAQTATTAPQTPPPPAFPCKEEKESAELDFWVGEWDVFTRGTQSGKSRIEVLPGGCLITEHFESLAGGYTGKSFNFYDPAAKAWKQTWVDNGGNIVYYEGQAKGGGMVFSGPAIGRRSASRLSRMVFTPNTDGTVRQLIEASKDGGKSWQTVFDGKYVRRKGGV